MKTVVTAALTALLAVPAAARPGKAVAAKPAAPANGDCLACHEDPEIEGAGGRKVSVGAPGFEASVHGQAGLACVDCHADLATATDFPHAEKIQKVDCSSCHSDAVSQYQAGIHGQSRQHNGGGLAATCTDCHGSAHEVRSSKDPQSATYHFNLPKTCGRCHGDAETIRKAGIEAGNVPAVFHDSIHGKALDESGLLVAPTCATCHGHHDIRRKADPASRVFKANVPATCGSCHAGIESKYEVGVHAAEVKAGNLAAAVCSDCHSAHDIHRKDDPRSRVAPGQRLATCRQCHPQANQNLVKYDPHADPARKDRSAPVYYTSRFMRILLGAVFAFFGVHTALWFPREVRARRARVRGVVTPPPPAAPPPAAGTGGGGEGTHGA